MTPEYDLSGSKFDEVTSFLQRSGAKQVLRTRGAILGEQIIDLDFDGEPVVIISRGFLRVRRTIHMSRDTADKFGEAGIELPPVKKKGEH